MTEQSITTGKTKVRNSNMELLRIILMLFIIMHHIFVHALDAVPKPPPENLGIDDFGVWFVNNCVYVGVNCFLLISGYFGIKLSFSKLARIYLQCSIIALLCYVFHILYSGEAITTDIFLWVLLPISNTGCWFVTVYFMLMLVSPILNLAFEKMDKRMHIYFLIALFTINVYFGWYWNNIVDQSGSTLMHFIMMYHIGYFIKHHFDAVRKIKPWQALLMWLIFALMSTGYDFLAVWGKIICKNSPFSMAASISFFIAFINVEFKNKVINYMATGVFTVYLIHENTFMTKPIYDFGRGLYSSNIGGVVLYAIIILAVGVVVGFGLNALVDAIMRSRIGKALDKVHLPITPQTV